MKTERATKLEDASDREMQLSNRAASILGRDPTHVDRQGRKWPIVQRRNPKSRPPTFGIWPWGNFGVIGRPGDWAVTHSGDGTMVEDGIETLSGALERARDFVSK